MSDVADGLGQQRPAARHAGIGLDRSLAGHGTDAKHAVAHPDAAERLDTVEIDQNRGPSQTEVEQRHQALPAGERPRIPAMRREQFHGLGHIARAFIGEWRRFHRLARPRGRSDDPDLMPAQGCGSVRGFIVPDPGAERVDEIQRIPRG